MGAAQAVTTTVVIQAGVRLGMAKDPGLRSRTVQVQWKNKDWEDRNWLGLNGGDRPRDTKPEPAGLAGLPT